MIQSCCIEYYNISALGVPKPVGCAFCNDVVARHEGGDHGFGWDLKRLDNLMQCDLKNRI